MPSRPRFSLGRDRWSRDQGLLKEPGIRPVQQVSVVVVAWRANIGEFWRGPRLDGLVTAIVRRLRVKMPAAIRWPLQRQQSGGNQ